MLSEQIHNFSKEGDKLPGRSTPFMVQSVERARHEGDPLPCSRTCILQVLSCVAALLGFYY